VATRDEELVKAAELTAKQLQQAIDIVASQFGSENAARDSALVAAVMVALADNYREKTK